MQKSTSPPPTLISFISTLPDFRPERLPSLYSSLASLSVLNRDGYEANLHAWSTALTLACKAGLIPGNNTDRLVIRISNELVAALSQREFGAPVGIATVVREEVNRGNWVDLEDFLKSGEGWGIGTVAGGVLKVVKWGFGLALGGGDGGSVEDEAVKEGRWVLVKAVEELANDISKQYSSRTRKLDRLFTLQTLQQEIYYTHNLQISATDTKVLATYLSTRMKTTTYDSVKGVLKFPSGTEEKGITQEDTTLLQLKTTLNSLEKSLDTLTEKYDKLKSEARAYMSQTPIPNKTRALAALKSAKIVEQNIKTQTDHSVRLEELLAGIESAHNNADMVKAMEAGGLLLKELNQSVGGVERVDEVMDRVREGIEEGKEITDVLGGAVQVDEGEIEDELEEMIKEEEEKKQMEEDARLLKDRYKEAEERERRIREGDRDEQMVRELTSSLEDLKVGRDGKEREREGMLPAF
ncbi:hypothetical protein BJ508DRAFT_416041 [Ascobolus immersus RN42]|uniref:Snf7-domain-containing protein n=1 Tax=Ascobolus immersus RN42 TaxID=1160509 RepID=A0A3N4I3K5_ASCIM|nr:hypothetical protein BJ508DRAFT_416041 [Ascobolus immersus RN42]